MPLRPLGGVWNAIGERPGVLLREECAHVGRVDDTTSSSIVRRSNAILLGATARCQLSALNISASTPSLCSLPASPPYVCSAPRATESYLPRETLVRGGILNSTERRLVPKMFRHSPRSEIGSNGERFIAPLGALCVSHTADGVSHNALWLLLLLLSSR